jgi:hypothetical protein
MSLFDLLEECARLDVDTVDRTGYFLPGYPEVPATSFINALERRVYGVGPGPPGLALLVVSCHMSEITSRLSAAVADRYRIERELGAGGMATVYVARDLKHQRQVALKVLRPELAAALGPDRFLREINIAAQLHSPHILPLLDSGEADGLLFYVMPYLPGDSLRDRLAREGPIPPSEAMRLLRDVVDGLAHAHRQGVVHRDIKPDNVMIAERPAGGV